MVQLTGADGNVSKTYDYDAFGNEKNSDANDTNVFRYCSEYFDKETGTIYLRARYYDPEIGRFITEDEFMGYEDDPLSLNYYTYCNNDPINFLDPTGHWKEGDERFANNPTVLDQLQYYSDMWEYANTAYKLGIIDGFEENALKWVASSQADAVRYQADYPIKDALNKLGQGFVNAFFDFLPGGDMTITVGEEMSLSEKALSKIDTPASLALITSTLSKNKTYTVYVLKDANDNVKYVGRTSNPLARKIQHSLSEKRGLIFEKVYSDLTYSESRGLEQTLFQKYGGFEKLLNKIHPIRFKNPKILRYMDDALKYLNKLK